MFRFSDYWFRRCSGLPSWGDNEVGKKGPQSCIGPQFSLSLDLLQDLCNTCPNLHTLALEFCNIDCRTVSFLCMYLCVFFLFLFCFTGEELRFLVSFVREWGYYLSRRVISNFEDRKKNKNKFIISSCLFFIYADNKKRWMAKLNDGLFCFDARAKKLKYIINK